MAANGTYDLFICAKNFDAACILAKMLTLNSLPIGPRHEKRELAEDWCKLLNGPHPIIGREDKVFFVRVEWRYGPDGSMFNYSDLDQLTTV